MARIHIVFDPNDKLTMRPDLEKVAGLKSAVMPLLDEAGYLDIKQTSEKLVAMFLVQLGYKPVPDPAGGGE